MSINLSFRNKQGQFTKHNKLAGDIAVKIGGMVAMILFERAFNYAVDKAQEYMEAKNTEQPKQPENRIAVI